MKLEVKKYGIIVFLILVAVGAQAQLIISPDNFDEELQIVDLIGANPQIEVHSCTSGSTSFYFRFSVQEFSNIDLNIGFGIGTSQKIYLGSIIIFGPFLCDDTISITDLTSQNRTFPYYVVDSSLPEGSGNIQNYPFTESFEAGNYIVQIKACNTTGNLLWNNMTFTNLADPIYDELWCESDTLTICDWYPLECEECDLYPELCDSTSTPTPPCDNVITTIEGLDCPTCIGSFAPIPGELYLFEAWVREEDASPLDTHYENPKIKLRFYDDFDAQLGSEVALGASGPIIEEWQQISETLTIPVNAIRMEMELSVEDGDAYFDDVRVSPFNSAMKTYVYDQVNMRLVAEMDERNFATFYQYDDEGRLVAIKKETIRGIKTIQATQQNTATNNGD